MNGKRWHETSPWTGNTYHELPGGMVCASSPTLTDLDETDSTAELCELCGRWTLDKRPVWHDGEASTYCGDCADGTLPKRWIERQKEHSAR